MNVRLLVLATNCLLASQMTRAQDITPSHAPATGYLYSNPPYALIIYDCTGVDDNHLRCNLTQIRVRKKIEAKDLPAKMSEAMSRFDTPISKEEREGVLCQRMRLLVDWKEGRIPITSLPPEMAKQAAKQSVSPDQPDLLPTYRAMAAMCAGDNEPMKALTRESVHQNARTCLASGHTFSQTFQRADGGQGRNSWVVRGEPEGACGLVQVSRFEQAPKTMFGWRYVGQKIITIPTGDGWPLKCSDYDQSATVYDDESRPLKLDCEFIEFSPF